MSLERPTLTIILDLDGVITQTTRLHAQAWKQLFDEYLYQRTEQPKPEKLEDFSPFTTETDYVRYVDGRPRHDGVQTFLASRGLTLPYGDPDDAVGEEAICGLGNRKNIIFLKLFRQQIDDIQGVPPQRYPSWGHGGHGRHHAACPHQARDT